MKIFSRPPRRCWTRRRPGTLALPQPPEVKFANVNCGEGLGISTLLRRDLEAESDPDKRMADPGNHAKRKGKRRQGGKPEPLTPR